MIRPFEVEESELNIAVKNDVRNKILLVKGYMGEPKRGVDLLIDIGLRYNLLSVALCKQMGLVVETLVHTLVGFYWSAGKTVGTKVVATKVEDWQHPLKFHGP